MFHLDPNFDDHYFKCSLAVVHVRYLQTIFCFIFPRSQAINSDQNGPLRDKRNERCILPPLGIENNARFGIILFLKYPPYFSLQSSICTYYMPTDTDQLFCNLIG